ncbi:hypothetical protein TNCV_1693121 [Trichonephila clavipes]|nr:hypothetical protein TNCV_1693121 [Trichonephila clavipes]
MLPSTYRQGKKLFQTWCDEASLFPLIAKSGPDRRGKIADISQIAEKEFGNWVVKDLDPFSQAVPTVKKRRNKHCAFVFPRFGDDSASENLHCAPRHRSPTVKR